MAQNHTMLTKLYYYYTGNSVFKVFFKRIQIAFKPNQLRIACKRIFIHTNYHDVLQHIDYIMYINTKIQIKMIIITLLGSF